MNKISMMRFYKIFLVLMVSMSPSCVFAQVDFIDLHLKNGTTVSYPLSDVESVAFHTEATPGDGSEEYPFTPTEAQIAYQTQTAAQKVWVKGVIVGYVTGMSYEGATFGTADAVESNILIADNRWETSASRCIAVQLPAGDIRTALNLSKHPENLYHEVTICGTLDKYFTRAGLKTPTKYVLGPLASERPEGEVAVHPGCMEVPALISGDEFVCHTAFAHDGTTERVPNFYVSYSPTQHHAHWVAFRFDATTRQKNTTRAEGSSYPVDPDCNSSLPTTAFAGTGYDHGHLCASADRLYSSLANEQTFYMTNMSPQLPQFNRTYWNYYESHVQDIGRAAAFADTLYVVKGGTIGDGQISTTLSCSGIEVPVPKYYFMALLKVKAGQYQSMAFWMDHQEYGTVADKAAELRAHAISIDELEKRTGFDFFPCLPDAVESTVEAACDPSQWKL